MTLYEALKVFKQKYPRDKITEIEKLRDERGTYGFIVKNLRLSTYAIFCAKNSMNGGEVSVHEKIFLKAKEKDWPIIMFIVEHFYKFLWGDIEREGHPNERHGQPMVNFHIKHGRNLNKPKEPSNARTLDTAIAG